MNTQNLSADVQRLYDLANEIAPDPKAEKPNPRWHEEISRASADVLVGLVSVFSSGRAKETSRSRKALREAAMAEIERKNSRAIIDTLKSLDAATTTLNRRMFQLTIGGIVLAVVQVGIAIYQSIHDSMK